ncbi:Protein CBG25328 [Caenorhabditis briggsae]|uniref:Protein CBG25328 n=1 Tax=Caenorhabditis briggsae TaxID=6238 RepID=B6IH26_CAEBR|nr:Protein CBG25328 [Caenorhabditis briggsae]CAR99206.1 Protein CBG25328 [Caenorhabditis briggsae]
MMREKNNKKEMKPQRAKKGIFEDGLLQFSFLLSEL